ncbi:hypothetical protein [Parasedimentitalea psychrophila]|uniref:Uncharacterized protein n=1 Tax=Parasedimentitalea psychrophila TaxID=2997337 RepID=A0A9Y2P1P1_9RHOB|nr:hypothetical protein [Parasedimentitalea psychrophila]WIY24287.1 hypothetical protein QPJ95_17040 [Parasedimentitalea psychrophila]
MTKTILDLFKAMINATLLLLALCLFLGWMLMSSVQDVTAKLTDAIAQVAPVQHRIEGLRLEIAGLRSDITSRPELAVSGQLDALDQRLTALQHEMSELRQLPGDIIQIAAQTAASELVGHLGQLTSCQPPPY